MHSVHRAIPSANSQNIPRVRLLTSAPLRTIPADWRCSIAIVGVVWVLAAAPPFPPSPSLVRKSPPMTGLSVFVRTSACDCGIPEAPPPAECYPVTARGAHVCSIVLSARLVSRPETPFKPDHHHLLSPLFTHHPPVNTRACRDTLSLCLPPPLDALTPAS